MLTEKKDNIPESISNETLSSYIAKNNSYTISDKAYYTGFKHRSKVEFLRFFIV